MIKRFYNPYHHDLYVALFALIALGAILGLGYGFMEYEREYIDPCSIEPLVSADAPAFFDEYKDMSSEELQEKFSEAQEHAVRLTGSIGFVDIVGKEVYQVQAGEYILKNINICSVERAEIKNQHKDTRSKI